MKNVAVTGISGYVGTRLLARLDRTKGVRKIIGIDTREPRYASPKLVFYRRDIRQPFGDLFTANDVDTAVHLAFVIRPTRRTNLARQIDIQGTENLVQACREAGVRHLLHLSSYTVYGAYRRNAVPLTEETLRRPVPGLQYSQDKIDAERILGDFDASDTDVTVTILRCCPVIGPDAGGTGATILFQPAMMLGVTGRDPPMQFVHEDDLVNLMARLLARRKGGIFNVAGSGTLRYSEVARLLGKKLLKLPGWLMELSIRLSWAMHLQSASPVGVSFLKYPPVVSTARLAGEVGFKFRYSSREALASFARAASLDKHLSQM